MTHASSPLAALLAQRYAHHAPSLPPLPAAAEALLAQQLAHRSVRAYLDQPVPEGTAEAMVAAAQSAATSSNLQVWSVVAVRDAERRTRLSALCGQQAHIRQAPLFMAWVADLSRLDRIAQSLHKPAEANHFFEMFLVAVVDAALAAQNAVLVAEAMGLGTVYIGGLRNQPEAVAAELGLPPRSFGLFGMCVGWPDAARPADIKPRLPQAAVLHHERYDSAAEAAAMAAYDGVMQDFQRSQKMPVQPWQQQSSDRVAGPQTLSGRDRLVAALKALGHGLD